MSITFKRIVALGLAVWIGILTAFVEDRHHHSKHGSGTAACACAFSAASCSLPGNAHDSVSIADGAASSDSHAGFEICPACLFLKSFNQGAIAWIVRAPDIAAVPRAFRVGASIQPFEAETSRSPRAPPLRSS
jgi:hypothetical protein